MASPPYAKLSARIFALLPLQDISPEKNMGGFEWGGWLGWLAFAKRKRLGEMMGNVDG